MIRTLFRQTLINAPINEVFGFFAKAENLNRITPENLQFHILPPLPSLMYKGLFINYKIKLHGIPMKWKTEITHWNPPFAFQDTQVKGPYLLWKHLHVFDSLDDYTLMTDKVYYRIPGMFLEPMINRFFVNHKLQEIFDYREQAIKKIFSDNVQLSVNN